MVQKTYRLKNDPETTYATTGIDVYKYLENVNGEYRHAQKDTYIGFLRN